MTKHTLTATKREVFGKKINRLRKQGILPANIFGKNVDSLAIQISNTQFERVYKQAGETGIVYITVEGESKERPTLISNYTLHPVTDKSLHVDFYQVNLKEKVTAFVPVELTGESELLKSGAGVINTLINEIEIEALPTDIPEAFIFDISALKAIGDTLKVSSLTAPAGVEIQADPELVVISMSEPEKEEVVVAAPAEETAAAEVDASKTPATEAPKAE